MALPPVQTHWQKYVKYPTSVVQQSQKIGLDFNLRLYFIHWKLVIIFKIFHWDWSVLVHHIERSSPICLLNVRHLPRKSFYLLQLLHIQFFICLLQYNEITWKPCHCNRNKNSKFFWIPWFVKFILYSSVMRQKTEQLNILMIQSHMYYSAA